MEKVRDISFDIAKGIGIILVVIGHYVPDDAPLWYTGLVRFIYYFHMPLFFIIAGYFYDCSTRRTDYLPFVWSKFQRLMLPYFILSWAIVGTKVGIGRVMHVDHPVTLDALYRVFYLPEAGYFLWFVYVLFLAFCLAPLFKKGGRLIIFSIMALGLFFWDTAPQYFCIRQLCSHLVFFVWGMWVARSGGLRQAMSRYPLLWIVVVAGLSVVYDNMPSGVVATLLLLVLGITGSFMVFSVSAWLSRSTGPVSLGLSRIGVMSMTIYLFHTWIMAGGKAILTHILSGGNTIEFVLSALFIIGAGIVGPICLYKWVWTKNKFTARIFK